MGAEHNITQHYIIVRNITESDKYIKESNIYINDTWMIIEAMCYWSQQGEARRETERHKDEHYDKNERDRRNKGVSDRTDGEEKL